MIARTLTRALIRSSSVVIQAAGPAAALVALQAAAQSRRAISAEQQLDLAFSIEFLTVPAIGAWSLGLILGEEHGELWEVSWSRGSRAMKEVCDKVR